MISPQDLNVFAVRLADHFNLAELDELCLRLGVNPENLLHARKDEFIRDLLLYVDRRNELDTLLPHLRRLRPRIDWNIYFGLPPDEPDEPDTVNPESVEQDDGVLDIYISCVDHVDDLRWVHIELTPRLKAAGLRWEISGEEPPGQFRVQAVEQRVTRARHTVIILSPHYPVAQWEEFINVLAQTLGIEQRKNRLIPVQIAPVALPLRLRALNIVDFTKPNSADYNFKRLLDALQH